MAEISQLSQRIDAELAAARERIAQFRSDAQRAHAQREERYQKFVELIPKIRDIAAARLDKLAEKFKFAAKPSNRADGRGVELNFQTDLAHVRLTLDATHDEEVRNLVLDYDLEILPVFIKFTPHDRMETPVETPDMESVARWFDDRLVDFVKTYISIEFTEQYQRDHMVMDPVSKIRFPKAFAKCSLDRDGKTYFFVSDETRAQFDQTARKSGGD